jgi:protein ImuB
MQWAAIHGPRLVLDQALLGLGPEAEDHRIATIDSQRHEIVQCTRAAVQAGIHPGLRRASALALAHDLHLIPHETRIESQALESIAQWLLQFSPRVSRYGPTDLVLEIGRSLRLFGGAERLMHRIRTGLQHQGFQIHTACAPTACAAHLLARWQDKRCIEHESELPLGLADLPLALLRSAAPHLESLAQIGAHRLADLTPLPRQGLSQRYGPALLKEVDTALGRQLEALACIAPMARFDAQIELFSGVEQAEALLHAGGTLLERLCAWLQARGQATREAVLLALHERQRHAPSAPTRIPVRLSSASRDPHRMFTLLRERLLITRLPRAVHVLQLTCQETVPQSSPVATLFPESHPGTGPEALARLLERLQSRLGTDQVQRIEPFPDHRPERASRTAPWEASDQDSSSAQRSSSMQRSSSKQLAPSARLALEQSSVLPRPLWLLHAPVALEERRHRPYWRGALALLAGPERIETGWWDGHLVERDYFIAQTEEAAWVWIFRTRPTQGQSGWFLQGVFG